MGAAKARGTVLGNRTNLTKAAAIGQAAQVATTDKRAASVLPTIAGIQAAGVTTLRAIASELNERNTTTARGDLLERYGSCARAGPRVNSGPATWLILCYSNIGVAEMPLLSHCYQ